jgi:hypothetical protein
MRRLLMTTPLIFALITGSAIGCNDPALHPEMAVMQARLAAIGEQPESPMQLMYRFAGPTRVGVPGEVLLSFWPKSPVQEASYRVETSETLSTDLPADWSTIEAKGGIVTMQVTPRLAGHHFLEIVTRAATTAGEMIEHRSLIQVPVAIGHEPTAGQPKATDFGFAGQRLREALGR